MAILAGRNLWFGAEEQQYSDGTGKRKPGVDAEKPRLRHGFAMLGYKGFSMNENSRRAPKSRHPWLIALALGVFLITGGDLRAGDMQHPTHRERIENRGEIEKLLTDHTLYGRYVGGEPWTEYHSPDGRTAYRENNCTYQGHWWIASGLVCFRYEALNEGQPACFRLYRNGDRLDFDYEEGNGGWRLNAYSVDRRPGNPEKLPLQGQACVGV
jgi:hypothetical protein